MRVLWASNAPWTQGGYGMQTAQVTRLMRDHGHDVAIACNYGLEGRIDKWEEITVYPAGFAPWSKDTWPYLAAARGGWLITLVDCWTLDLDAYRGLRNIASWCPVDRLPSPVHNKLWFDGSGAVPIAMSKFGQRMLELDGLEPLYAPHGIDTATYRPHPKPDARARYGFPDDAFIVGMVANNKGRIPSRKSFPEAFLAFGKFAQDHPDAVLYVHAERTTIKDGLDLDLLAEACNIPEGQIVFGDQFAMRLGIPDSAMAELYSTMDVLLAPSRGEGFGIPVVEAQACGVPVIVTNATAQPELVGAGWTVGGQPEWDPDVCAWWTTPSVGELYEALGEARKAPSQSITARQFAIGYDHRTVFTEYWVPILAELEARTQTTEPLAAEAV